MKYYYEHILPNGVHVIIRSANPNDAIELHHLFNKTHSETDFLTTYPDESHFDLEKEMDSYQKLNDSENSCEILAVIDNKIIGSASLNFVSLKDKEKHRGVIGLSILKEYYGLGIGNILFSTIIELGKKAQYKQLELQVVSNNTSAISLYKKYNFIKYGENPKAFLNRENKYQSIDYMRLEIE